MAKVGRYSSCPMAGKIRGNRRTFKELMARMRKMRKPGDGYLLFTDYYPAYVPSGYKK